MRALLIVAHGSRRAASNDEVRILTDQIRRLSGDEFDDVRCAFLELARPSIPDGIEQCIQAGATLVKVFPYFLAAGHHVVEDIPNAVQEKRDEYPALDIELVDYLGASGSMGGLILQMAIRV